MNQRAQIYARQTSLNGYGEKSSVYSLLGSVWGRIKHKAPGESLISSKHKPVHNIEITARNFGGSTGDELEYNGYRWEVEGVRRRHRSNNIQIIANRLYSTANIIKYYRQPDGISSYLQPGGDKYLQP
jgi:hypothetical protein